MIRIIPAFPKHESYYLHCSRVEQRIKMRLSVCVRVIQTELEMTCTEWDHVEAVYLQCMVILKYLGILRASEVR